jgi:hypothetical protein
LGDCAKPRRWAGWPKLQTYLEPAVLLDEVGYLLLRRGRGEHALPHGRPPLRTRLDHPHLEQAFSAWAAITGDAVLATAFLDRLLHH